MPMNLLLTTPRYLRMVKRLKTTFTHKTVGPTRRWDPLDVIVNEIQRSLLNAIFLFDKVGSYIFGSKLTFSPHIFLIQKRSQIIVNLSFTGQ